LLQPARHLRDIAGRERARLAGPHSHITPLAT
jgi:hypothetical protein